MLRGGRIGLGSAEIASATVAASPLSPPTATTGGLLVRGALSATFGGPCQVRREIDKRVPLSRTVTSGPYLSVVIFFLHPHSLPLPFLQPLPLPFIIHPRHIIVPRGAVNADTAELPHDPSIAAGLAVPSELPL